MYRMEIINVLNEFEELIENSTHVPMTKKLLIDEDQLLDFLDRVRTMLPEEVRQAKWVIQEKEKVLDDTRKEASRILEDARKDLEKKAEDSEINKQAKLVAEEMVEKAEKIALEIRQGAKGYADEILRNLGENLSKIMSQIEQGRAELQSFR